MKGFWGAVKMRIGGCCGSECLLVFRKERRDYAWLKHTNLGLWPDRAEELTRLLKELAAAATPYITAPKPVRQPASATSGGGRHGAGGRHNVRR